MPTTPYNFSTGEVITETRLDTHTTAITELQAADVLQVARLDALEAENSVSTADIANEAVTRVKLAPAVITEIEGKTDLGHAHVMTDVSDADWAATIHTHSTSDLTDADYAATSHSHAIGDVSGVVPAAQGGAGTVTGILKADGLGTVTQASAGTDYLTPTGDGSGLTALNGSNISSGTVADGRLSSNVPLLNAANTFTNAQTIGSASADPTYSAELVTNGDFAAGDTGWTVGAGWSTAGGVATHTGGGGTNTLSQAITVSAGIYQITATVTSSAGSFTISVGGVTSEAFTSTVTTAIVATGTAGLAITPTNDFAGTIDNVSVKRVTAFPASVLSLRDSSGTVRLEFRASGTNNTFAGVNAGYSNTTGTNNVFAGYAAGYSNTTGGYNTFAGYAAGFSNTTGTNNTFAGYAAGYSSTTGTNNTIAGANAGRSNTTGSYNTFAGINAGRSNTTGSYNTYVGNGAGYTGTTANLTRATAIGYNAQATASNVLILGGSGATDGVKVGIGTTAPIYSLHIAPTGQANAGQTLFVQDATASTGKTRAVLKAGAGDTAADPILQIQNNAGAVILSFMNQIREAADDTAAAALTPPVPVGGVYRTGSVLKIRIA